MKKILLLVVLVCAIGCSSDNSPTSVLIPDDQILLAGLEYINWAWGYNHRAEYIDVRGYTYAIAYTLADSVWALDDSGYYSQEDIERLAEGAQRQQLNIPMHDVHLMYSLIPLADKGIYSDTSHDGADMGSVYKFAFYYNAPSDTYKKVILSVHGDFSYYNKSESAKQIDKLISKWLD